MSQNIFKKGMYFRRNDGALFVKRGSVYLSRRYPLRSTENRLLEISSIENQDDYTIIKKLQYNQMMNNLFNNNKLLNKDDKYKPGGVLEHDTTYYFRVKAVNAGGTAYSAELSQKTDFYATLTSTGTGAGVSTLRLEVSENQTLEIISGTARFYTDAGGTTGESTTWSVTTGALRTIYLKAPSGSSVLNIPKPNKVTKCGNSGTDGWISSTNAASIRLEVGKLTLTEFRITGASHLIGSLPTELTYLLLNGAQIAWTYTGALPTGLTYLHLSGDLIAWTYTGALPTGLTYLYLSGNLIAWTYTGALQTGLITVYLSGNSIAWTYTGALQTGLTTLYLSGSSINWSYRDWETM